MVALMGPGVKICLWSTQPAHLAALAYSSRSINNFGNSAVCNSAVLSHLPSFVSLFWRTEQKSLEYFFFIKSKFILLLISAAPLLLRISWCVGPNTDVIFIVCLISRWISSLIYRARERTMIQKHLGRDCRYYHHHHHHNCRHHHLYQHHTNHFIPLQICSRYF